MRYAFLIKYNGRDFLGWQKQPKGKTVQGIIEEKMSVFLARKTEILGCGRTDTGVHASYFVFHTDVIKSLPDDICYHLNKFVHPDIAFISFQKVSQDFHARYNAIAREYKYHLHWEKNPFSVGTSHYHPAAKNYDWNMLNDVNSWLVDQDTFAPFCKTGSDEQHFKVELSSAEFLVIPGESKAMFIVKANRFLRGMIRLWVGTLCRVAEGVVKVDELVKAFETQSVIPKRWSAPPEGLFLSHVEYPDLKF